jgi:hypothetical protein
MGAADLLTQLRDSGLTISADSGALHVSPAVALTDETRALIRANKPALLDALYSEGAPVTFWRWLIHFTDRDAVEVHFSPAATREEALAYPGALSAEPFPENPKRHATPAEIRELRLLISQILTPGMDSDRAEALEIALGDPDAALACFRGFVSNLERRA